MTSQTRHIIEGFIEQIGSNLRMLEALKTNEGADTPSQSERAAIERIEAMLKRCASELESERL